jgi:hypothetical protein
MNRPTEPIGRTVKFSAACHVCPTGILWKREPTPDEMRADDYLVQRGHESLPWWTGDLIISLWKHGGADKSLTAFSAEYARGRDKNEKTCEQYASVAYFFPLADRCGKPLDWAHHYIVWSRLRNSGLTVCRTWLHRARSGGKADGRHGAKGKPWSPGRLREEINAEMRGIGEAKEPPAPVGIEDEMANVETWAQRSIPKIARMSPERANEILRRIPALAAIVDDLRSTLTPGWREPR